MSIKVIQTLSKQTPSSSVSVASTGIALKSGYLRVSTGATGAYVDIGVTPNATTSSFHIPAQNFQVFKERVARQVVIGITTGSSTVISFSENTGNPFNVGDYATIENAYPVAINTTHNQITAATPTSITISFDSSQITGVAYTTASVARSVKISSLAQNNSTDVSICEVQVTGVI